MSCCSLRLQHCLSLKNRPQLKDINSLQCQGSEITTLRSTFEQLSNGLTLMFVHGRCNVQTEGVRGTKAFYVTSSCTSMETSLLGTVRIGLA